MKTIKTTAQPCRDGDHYLISCPGYWGKGETVTKAVKALPYGLDEKSWILYSIDPETYINGDGFFVHKVDHAPVEIDCCAAKKKRLTR